MHRHHNGGVLGAVVVVHVRIERDLVQIRIEIEIGVGLHALHDAGLELGDVFEPRDVFVAAFGLQSQRIAGPLNHSVIKRIERQRRYGALQLRDHAAELLHLLSGGDAGPVGRCGHRLKKRDILRRGDLADPFQACHADTARRLVHNAQKARFVRRVSDHVEICQNVLDLRAVKKARAAEDPVRDRAALERKLDAARLRIRPVKNGKIAHWAARGADGAGDEVGLIVFVVRLVQRNGIAAGLRRPERFALSLAVVRNNGVCRGEDVSGRAVILFKPDDARLRILFFKGKDIFDRRAAEFVYALIVIADNTYVSAAARYECGKEILQMVCVLILIDENVAEFSLIIREHVRIILQKPDGVVKEIVKVHGSGVPKVLGVCRADLRGADAADIPGALLGSHGVLRRNERTLIPARRGKHGLWREYLVIHVLIAQNPLHNRKAVRLIVDRKALRKTETVGVPPQDTHARAVERKRPDVAPGLAELDFQAALQLVGGLVRKRDRKDLPRRRGIDGTHAADALRHRCASGGGVLECGEHFLIRAGRKLSRVRTPAKAEDVPYTVDQHRRFPAAGARKQKERALRCQNGFALFRIQIGVFFFNDLPPRGGKPAGKILGHGARSSVSLV